MRVDFGGTPATITAISNTTIVVSTPIRTLANPNNPETVDVTVTDLGSPTQRCARVVSGFTYTAAALTPTIYSVSPRTGPNDATTRVSIFGDGFQFPMQVFLTGGTCGAQLVEASVASITLNTIVFSAPAAEGGNVCLSSQLVDIVIKNPSTGKGTSCPACFKYYSCPTITTADPVFGDYRGVPRVLVNGHNFEEPIAISGAGTPWVPISVSASQIVATAPQPINIPTCADISGPILVNSPALSCPNAVGPIFTYIVVALGPVIYSINPTHVSEAGGETVTITGKNFLVDPHTSLGINFGAGGGSERITPTTMTDTQIVFVAPKFGGTFLKIPCDLPGGATGTKKIPTPVLVQVTNPTTHCFAGVSLLYDPDDQTCHAGGGGATIAANFTFTNGPGGSLILNFTDTSTATGTTINSWTWDFGDGSPTVTIQKPPASNGNTSHTFTGPGTFNVTLSATDGTIIGVKSQPVTPP
jgi:PKD repeat protein